MKSADSRAAESFADAAQSMLPMSSPGWYGLELATSDPRPRRALCMLPKARPIRRRCGTSGKVSSVGPDMLRREGDDFSVTSERRLGPGRRGEAALAEVLLRLRAADPADLDEEGRREQDPMAEHRQEKHLDVLGQDVVASAEERPAARGALEREAAANGRADRDDLEVARRADDVDHPA